jgi:uncharacterized protein YndB with AHSA1/START domain
MPTTRVSRTVAAAPEDVWRVLADPHSIPRWWPRVSRVEGADSQRWTQVLYTAKGRGIRADFFKTADEPISRYAWEQHLDGTPFARFLARAEWETRLAPAGDGTAVTIESRHRLQGWSRFAPFLFKRAMRRQLNEALDGLERIAA